MPLHLQFTNRTEGDKVVGDLPLAAEPDSLTSNPSELLTCKMETIKHKKIYHPTKSKKRHVYLECWFPNKTRERRNCSKIKGNLEVLISKTAEFEIKDKK